MRCTLLVSTAPSADGDYWPCRDLIMIAQSEKNKPPPPGATLEDDGLILLEGRVWISGNDDGLKLKLLTISHAGTSGHRGIESTFESIREQFFRTGMRRDTGDFLSACLFCILPKSGSKISWPMATTLNASKPNKVLHFDYLYICTSSSGPKYVLVLKNDLSGYFWLDSTSTENADHATFTLARYNRVFSAHEIWMSDQGSHFTNETLHAMAADHRIAHRPTIEYAPCNISQVAVICAARAKGADEK